MTKKQLELENLVLRNVIDCIKEKMEVFENAYTLTDEVVAEQAMECIGGIQAHIENTQSNINYANMMGYALDYRKGYRKSDYSVIRRIYPSSSKQTTE